MDVPYPKNTLYLLGDGNTVSTARLPTSLRDWKNLLTAGTDAVPLADVT